MNGPPGNGEAARTLDRSEAAEERHAAPTLDDEAEERNRLQLLQGRAAGVGASLSQASRGYMLRRGAHSWHSGALDALAGVLGRLEGKR